jgi:hypothetical protein
MVKAKRRLTDGLPLIPVDDPKIAAKRSEPSLFLLRIKELDREFTKQTKQLTKLARSLKKKWTNKL